MKKQNKSVILIFFVVIVIFFIIYFFNLNSRITTTFSSIFSPLEEKLTSFGLTIKKIGQLGAIIKENESMKNELSKISLDYIRLLDLEKENEYLKKELGYLKSNNYSYILADVIGKQLYNDQIIIINKGQNNGLRKDLAVTYGQGVIIGKIIAVNDNRAEIQLLTDPASELAGTTNQESGTSGIIQGRAGNSLEMQYIPQNIKLNDGDSVITSGLEENIPRGLLIGKINGSESLVGQVFQKANVLPPFNYQNLLLVTIILQQK